MLRRYSRLPVRPALADLARERENDLPREVGGAQRGELESEQPPKLGTVEPIESGEDLVQAPPREGGFGPGRHALQLRKLETRDLADTVAGSYGGLYQPEALEVGCAVAPRTAGAAHRLDHSMAPLPGAQKLRRQAREPGRRSEGIGELDRFGFGSFHGSYSRQMEICVEILS